MNSYPELYALAQQRYSCRSYSPAPVPEDALMAVLDVARLAPSACNRQPWRFIVIGSEDEEGRNAILKSYNREWIASAPVYIVICGVPSEGWVRACDNHSHIDVDTSIATEHMCLAATDCGLATCWICNFDPKTLAEDLHLSDDIVPIAILPVGYAAEGSPVPTKQRRKLDEIVIRR